MIQIARLPSGWVTVSKAGGNQLITLHHDEQRELLEALAYIHGLTLDEPDEDIPEE